MDRMDRIDSLIKSTKTLKEIIESKRIRVTEIDDKLARLGQLKEENNVEKSILNNKKLAMVDGKFVVDNSIELRASILDNRRDEVEFDSKYNKLMKERTQLANEIIEYNIKDKQNKLKGWV